VGEVRVPRTGLGFDVHRFDPGRPLWLGGVLFEGDGLAGHSDGDVVCHALADAMLGAGVLGDLGEHFPDTEPSLAGIAGTALLQRVVALLDDAGWSLSSCDLTVICDRPAIAPRRDEIRGRLAVVLGAPVDHVSVKATRPEGLGLVGDGIGCLAVAVVV
jgi:2-C-methyl-D-erythritol 4-phosphate cytidylyltransferase / 2-C-methyl-D-erythritol 2,4-cyclodiphosphate synthase